MKLSMPDNMLSVLVLATIQAAFLVRFYKQPMFGRMLIINVAVFLFFAIPLVGLSRFPRYRTVHRMVLFGILTVVFGAVAVQCWMRREPVSALTFAGASLFGAIGIVRKLFRSAHGGQREKVDDAQSRR